MLSNTITVFITVNHLTNINEYLQSLAQVINQDLSKDIKLVDIVTIGSHQIHADVLKLYEDVEGIKGRFSNWPEKFSLKWFVSDDNSFNKIRNYTDNHSKGEYGELVTFKSVTPIEFYPNHFNCHWEEYKRNKKNFGWSLSRLEVKDLSKKDDEKQNTFTYRLEDFPKHIDTIVPDEIFISYELCRAIDFNSATMTQRAPDGTSVAMFHVGKLVTDELIPKATEMALKGYNPNEISVIHWVDLQAMQQAHQAQAQQQIQDNTTQQENEDGSVSFLEEDENGAVQFTED